MNKLLIIPPVVLLVLFLVNTIHQSNYLKDFTDHNINNCVVIANINGPEDIEKIDTENLIISSYVHGGIHGGANTGALYSFNLKNQQINLLSSELDFPLYPHGIATIGKSIFVINHHPEGDRIEKFKWENSRISFEKSYMNEQLKLANDIAPISDNQFFVTIDHGLKSKWGQLIENYTRIGFGKVLFYNGDKFINVIDGLSYANGIAVDLINKRLYVAEMIGKKINVYNIDSLVMPVKIAEIPLVGFPDNITLDLINQQLWVASHLKILSLKKHSQKHEEETSPSSIVKVDLKTFNKTLIFQSSSIAYSGISVAAAADEFYYLGSIFGKNMYRCFKP